MINFMREIVIRAFLLFAVMIYGLIATVRIILEGIRESPVETIVWFSVLAIFVYGLLCMFRLFAYMYRITTRFVVNFRKFFEVARHKI